LSDFIGARTLVSEDPRRVNRAQELISVPVVCVFAVFQRFVVGGLTAGSVRG
jgi:ABC-type maltose transport system permease subunit